MDRFIARLRGLPFTADEDAIMKFLEETRTLGGKEGVHLCYGRDGRKSGEAFVEFESEADLEKALEKHNEHMGQRYIEVFKTKASEMEWVTGKVSGPSFGEEGGVVRLRGLPYECSKEEISQFFNGYEIVPNGISVSLDPQGRSTGEAHVQFKTKAMADEAMKEKNKKSIGHRYIEIFKSSHWEIGAGGMGAMGGRMGMRGPMGMGRPGPYDRGDRYAPMGGPMGRYGGPGGFGGNVKGPGGMYGYGGYGGGYGYGAPPMAMGMGRGGFGGPRSQGPPGHSIHMRGLPFKASENDIMDFFKPLIPCGVHIHYEGGRATGEADVEFETHRDAQDAMTKDKQNMQHRYIELFLNSAEGAGRGRPGGFRNGGFGGYGFGAGGDFGGYY